MKKETNNSNEEIEKGVENHQEEPTNSKYTTVILGFGVPFLIVWLLFYLFTFPVFYAGVASLICCLVPYLMSFMDEEVVNRTKYVKVTTYKTQSELIREKKLKKLKIMQDDFDNEVQ